MSSQSCNSYWGSISHMCLYNVENNNILLWDSNLLRTSEYTKPGPRTSENTSRKTMVKVKFKVKVKR